MKKLVVLSGAGISAESGIKTFRDADGLWEGHEVLEVASPIGWQRNKNLVLDFKICALQKHQFGQYHHCKYYR